MSTRGFKIGQSLFYRTAGYRGIPLLYDHRFWICKGKITPLKEGEK
jgi:hypothetical protein